MHSQSLEGQSMFWLYPASSPFEKVLLETASKDSSSSQPVSVIVKYGLGGGMVAAWAHPAQSRANPVNTRKSFALIPSLASVSECKGNNTSTGRKNELGEPLVSTVGKVPDGFRSLATHRTLFWAGPMAGLLGLIGPPQRPGFEDPYS